MPAPFVVRNAKPNNGIRQLHLSLDYLGQPNEVLMNVTAEILAGIFGEQGVKEGDVWELTGRLLHRPGANGPTQA